MHNSLEMLSMSRADGQYPVALSMMPQQLAQPYGMTTSQSFDTALQAPMMYPYGITGMPSMQTSYQQVGVFAGTFQAPRNGSMGMTLPHQTRDVIFRHNRHAFAPNGSMHQDTRFAGQAGYLQHHEMGSQSNNSVGLPSYNNNTNSRRGGYNHNNNNNLANNRQGHGQHRGRGEQQQQQYQRPQRPEDKEKRSRTAYITSIDQRVTEADLAAFFSDCGQVLDCRICGDSNSSMRFAFVEFQTQDGLTEAVGRTGVLLGKLPLRVSQSKTAIVPVSKDLMPRSLEEIERCGRTVYITNIGRMVERVDVREFFEASCGKISKLRLLGDHVHPTRIAFVEFKEAEGAVAALDCSGVALGALPIRVFPSKTPVRQDAGRLVEVYDDEEEGGGSTVSRHQQL